MTPIVLQHGIFGFDELRLGKLRYAYFHGIDKAIQKLGHPLILSRVHPTSSVANRAQQLKDTILGYLAASANPDGRVIILAHSMGGLDARYMISRLGMAGRVSALVTICTPHRGSPYADWCIENLGRKLGGMKLLNLLKIDLAALRDLTTGACVQLNHSVIDDPQVRYYSISAARPWHLVPPWMMPAYKVVHEAEGDNDGVVSVKSAIWGEHLGTWPADHLHAINRRMVVEIRNPTGDITPRYLEVLERLRADGIS